MRILPNDEKLVYCGRIDWSDKKAPVWIYPGTFVKLRFAGNTLKVIVRNKCSYWDNYLGFIVDGVQTKQLLPKEGTAVLEVPISKTENDIHNVMVFKRQDACHELTILGFELEDGEELMMPEPLPERRMEIYGDSVSAGEVSEALDCVGKEDPRHNGQYSNSWYSYGWIAARRLKAQLHDIAQGGIALYDGIGWFHAPDYIGMESAWDKLRYNPDFGELTSWDFTQYTPQVVVVAVGQNDANPEDFMKKDYEGQKAQYWREHYKAFIRGIRAKYPQAYIICCTTLLNHDVSWDMSVSQAVQDLADERVFHYVYQRNGKATPGHLRVPEAEEMAQELCAYIRNLQIDGWE